MMPPIVIKIMTIVRGHVPKQRKPPRVVMNGIDGRGTTREDDLVPIGPKGP